MLWRGWLLWYVKVIFLLAFWLSLIEFAYLLILLYKLVNLINPLPISIINMPKLDTLVDHIVIADSMTEISSLECPIPKSEMWVVFEHGFDVPHCKIL